MAVDFDNLFDGGGLEEGGGDALFDAEDNAAAGGDADGGAAELDCFERVFDLEEAAFGGEGAAVVWLEGGCGRGGGGWVGEGGGAYLIPRSVKIVSLELELGTM